MGSADTLKKGMFAQVALKVSRSAPRVPIKP